MRLLATLLLAALAIRPVNAQTAEAPDKSGYTFFNPTPASALRAFNTDRPTKSNVATTVDAGHFQYESDVVSYTHSNVGGVSTRLVAVFDPVVKVGLTNRTDLEVQFGGYQWLSGNQRGLAARGAGDLTIRAKVNLLGDESGVAVALIPYFKVPTASAGLGNGHTEGGVIAPISVPLPLGFTLLLGAEVDVLRNAADAGHHFNFTQLVNVAHPIGSKVNVYAELYSMVGTDHRTPPVYTFDVAATYAVTDRLQFDVGANVGLNRSAPNLQLYTGIGQRF